MVGIVAACHSTNLAKGIYEIASQMAPDVPFKAVGGTSDGRLGSDPYMIAEAVNSVNTGDGVIVLFDLGSSGMNSRIAVELIPFDEQKNCHVCSAALVEGAIIAVVESSIGKNMDEIELSLQDVWIKKLD